MRRVLRTTAVLSAVAIAACSDVLPPDSGGGGDFDVGVSSGTQPTYTWPGGPARRVDVVPLDNPLVPVWSVASASTSSSTITSGLRHGVTPQGAIELTAEERVLTAGERYRVTVTLLDQRRGSRDFRP